MGKRIDEFKKRRFTDRGIEGFGAFRVLHLNVGELFKATEGDDSKLRVKKVVLASAYEGDAPMFTSIEEIDTIEYWLFDAISDAVAEVNRISKKDAEKKSGTLPSSA